MNKNQRRKKNRNNKKSKSIVIRKQALKRQTNSENKVVKNG